MGADVILFSIEVTKRVYRHVIISDLAGCGLFRESKEHSNLTSSNPHTCTDVSDEPPASVP
jgi:hypothetical protein